MLATIINERPANVFSGIIIDISPNLKPVPAHKSLDVIESSSNNEKFPSNESFLEIALDFAFKSSNFVAHSVPRQE